MANKYRPKPGPKNYDQYGIEAGSHPRYDYYGEQPGYVYNPYTDTYQIDQEAQKGYSGVKEPKKQGLGDIVVPVAASAAAIKGAEALATEGMAKLLGEKAAEEAVSHIASSAAASAPEMLAPALEPMLPSAAGEAGVLGGAASGGGGGGGAAATTATGVPLAVPLMALAIALGPKWAPGVAQMGEALSEKFLGTGDPKLPTFGQDPEFFQKAINQLDPYMPEGSTLQEKANLTAEMDNKGLLNFMGHGVKGENGMVASEDAGVGIGDRGTGLALSHAQDVSRGVDPSQSGAITVSDLINKTTPELADQYQNSVGLHKWGAGKKVGGQAVGLQAGIAGARQIDALKKKAQDAYDLAMARASGQPEFEV